MRIDVSELLEKVGNEIDLFVSERLSYPEDNLILTSPVRSHIHLTSAGQLILLQGEVAASVEMECSRCLTRYAQGMKFKVEEVYREKIPTPGTAKLELELAEEDFVFPIGGDKIVDLSEAIRQNLIMWLPMKPLCRTDCAGISIQKEE